MGSLGGLLHHLGLKVGVLHVGPDLDNDLWRDVVLVIRLKLLQEACRRKQPCSWIHFIADLVETILGRYVARKRKCLVVCSSCDTDSCDVYVLHC